MALIDKIAKFSNNSPFQSSGLSIPGSSMEIPTKVKPFEELGATGLARMRGTGIIFEEFLAELSSGRQKQVYREMRDNDAVIGSMFFALEMILRRAEWRVEPAKGSKGDDIGQFVEECMQDCSHTWEDFVAEIISMFCFGFALFETVYKRRNGESGKKPSRFDDGLIGWRKFAPRAQESILYWSWDEEGGLQGAIQLAPPDYRTVALPIEKLLLFRTTSQKQSPEGRSLLRNVYRSWFMKRRIEEVEGIGIERDLCGLPVLYVSAEALAEMGGMPAAKRLVTNVRMDDQAGLVLPQVYDEKGNKMVEFSLVRSGGSKGSVAAATAIKRYNQDMLNTIMAGFIQFGESPTGSRALHLSATAIFSDAIAAFMDSVSAIMNRIAIPRLMALNGMDLKLVPKLVPGEVGVKNIAELAGYIASLSQSGLTFFDSETAGYLRKIGGLPDLPDKAEAPPAGSSAQQPLPPAPQQPPPAKQPIPKGGEPAMKPKGANAPVDEQEANDRMQGVA